MLATVDWPSAALWLARLFLVGTVWFGVLWGLLLVVREPARRVTLCLIALLGGLAIPLFLAMPIIREVSVAPAFRLNVARAADWIPEPSPAKSPPQRRSLDEIRSLPQVPQPRSAAPAPLFEGLWMPVADGTPAAEEQSALVKSAIVTSPAPPVSIDAPSSRTLWIAITLIAVVSVYGVGVLALGTWYVVGLIGLGLLVRRGRAPSPELASLWQNVCERGECRASLLVSDSVAQPIACWMGRAYVILPAGWSRAADERLTWALAHEAEHIRQHDFWGWQVANLARVLFWCQPLAWWLRRELRLAQDHLADAAAARAPHVAVDYAEFLTESARVGAGRVPLIGLGLFGGRSDLYRRVAMLLKRDRPIERRSPRWWRLAVAGVGSVTLVALATIRVVAEPPAAPKFFPEAAPERATAASRPTNAEPAPLYRPGPSAAPAGSNAVPPAGGFYNPPEIGTVAAPIRILGPAVHISPSGNSTVANIGGAGSKTAETETSPAPSSPRIEKLKVDQGAVEPEPGVFVSLVSIMDPTGNLWSMDGSRIDPTGLGSSGEGGAGFGGSMGPMSGSPMGMMMGGPPGYAPAGGYGSNAMPADHRMRTVAIHVRRPGPSGIQTSVDGRAASVSTTQLAEPKVRQILQTAYWPEEQMTGSVGVRFASKTIARELVATDRKGETFRTKEGETEACVGPWTDEGELRTSVRLDQARPNDPRFVVTAVARDVDGSLHTGRLEQRAHHGIGGMGGAGFGGYGEGMAAMGMGGAPSAEWHMVFAHLPVSRIQEIRITWHPYAWVIFRDVSLEVDHKTTPTAELFLDKAAPPVMPKEEPKPNPTGTDPAAQPNSNPAGIAPSNGTSSVSPPTRPLNQLGEGPDVVNLPIRVAPDSHAALLQADDQVTLFVTFKRDEGTVTEPLIGGVPIVATNVKLVQGRIAHVLRLTRDAADLVNLAERAGTITMLPDAPDDESRELNELLKTELETLSGQKIDATVLR